MALLNHRATFIADGDTLTSLTVRRKPAGGSSAGFYLLKGLPAARSAL
jgi:hypothetical protein